MGSGKLGKLQKISNYINGPYEYIPNRIMDWVGGEGSSHRMERWRADKGDRWESGIAGGLLSRFFPGVGSLLGQVNANLLAIENEEADNADRRRNMEAAGWGSLAGNLWGGASNAYSGDTSGYGQMGSALGKLLGKIGGGSQDSGNTMTSSSTGAQPKQNKSDDLLTLAMAAQQKTEQEQSERARDTELFSNLNQNMAPPPKTSTDNLSPYYYNAKNMNISPILAAILSSRS